MIYEGFNWRNPDYGKVLAQRVEALERIRAEPEILPELMEFYRQDENIAQFINDWGITFDPRNAEIGLPTLFPFVLFPKQVEWVRAVIQHWRDRKPLIAEKSRDWGLTWLAGCTAATLCIMHEGLSIGFGSRKVTLVDELGNPKAIFPKIRMFLDHLPVEFRGGYEPWRDGSKLRLTIPKTGSVIGGEGGDQIGRGDRTTIYFIDESAYLEQPDLIDASLSATTNCRIDISTPCGMNNSFARKRWEGKIDVLICDWRDDPRKDDAWYAKQTAELDPVVVAQEIDRDYSASVHGIVIPNLWVRSAIGAAEKLGLKPTGPVRLALDVADEGRDKNAICAAKGFEVFLVREWSGKGGDLFQTVQTAIDICDEVGVRGEFIYDADGMGAGVRGDARIINDRRRVARAQTFSPVPFRGSGEVIDPEGQVEPTGDGRPARLNKDYFKNAKAQAWWALRKRFGLTHRWITQGIPADPDSIISLRSDMPLLMRLVAELSQPIYAQDATGKMLIDKSPDGMKSPNLADAVMMRFAPTGPRPMIWTDQMVAQLAAAGARDRRRY